MVRTFLGGYLNAKSQMTKLLPILFMSILLSGEMEVDGNLKVTGTVESTTFVV